MNPEARANANVINFPGPRPAIDGSLALSLVPQVAPKDNVVSIEAHRRNPLQEQIDYFDQNYQTEGLPRDWWNINDVGFSMKRQMRLLSETGDRKSWVKQVERDLRGFALEYLRQGTVFPVEYEIVSGELADARYGDRRLLDTVDPSERAGAVRESLSKIQEYLVDGKEGAMAIMVSPPGWTGLEMDNGERIEYQDTQTFYFQKTGGRVLGMGLRTDFSLQEARILIKYLTGQDLGPSASVIDCVKAISIITPETESIGSANDLVGVLKKVKEESRPAEARYAHKIKPWQEMERDIDRRQELYEFDERAGEIINEFKEYVLLGKHTQEEIQKALAATFLRLSKYFLVDKKIQYGEIRTETYHARDIDAMRAMTYGQIVEEVQKLPGCAGGGSGVSSISSIINRTTYTGENAKNDPDLCRCNSQEPHFHCDCGFPIIVGKGISVCPSCKADEKC